MILKAIAKLALRDDLNFLLGKHLILILFYFKIHVTIDESLQ